MSKRNAGRRGKARKRRGAAVPSVKTGDAASLDTGGAPISTSAAAGTSQARAATRQRGARSGPAQRGTHRDPGGVGERPDAPWHPWPFSELLILVGAIGT